MLFVSIEEDVAGSEQTQHFACNVSTWRMKAIEFVAIGVQNLDNKM